MGLDFYIWEVQSQSAAAIQLANEYAQFSSMLKHSINSFLNAPLSGKAYDSAKIYFSTVYPPLANAFVLTCEAFIEAHKKLPAEFQAHVATTDVIEDQLKAQIAQGQILLAKTAVLIDQHHTKDFGLEKRYENLCLSIQQLEEKLTRLYEFNAYSVELFAEYDQLRIYLEAGLAEVEKGLAWNRKTGIFELNKMNLEWTKPIKLAWKARTEKRAVVLTNKELQVNSDEKKTALARTGARQLFAVKATGTHNRPKPLIGSAIVYQKQVLSRKAKYAAFTKIDLYTTGNLRLGLSIVGIAFSKKLAVAIYYRTKKTVGHAVKAGEQWLGCLFK